MKIFAKEAFRIFKRILFGAIVCMYMSLSLYILDNRDDFVLGDYAFLLVWGFSLYIFYCVGETINNSDKRLENE